MLAPLTTPKLPHAIKTRKVISYSLTACVLIAIAVGSILILRRDSTTKSGDSVPQTVLNSRSAESPQGKVSPQRPSDTGSQDSGTPSRYPSEPFTGYPAAMESSVVDAFRYRAGFDGLTESEAAYKALVGDAHFLYFGFIRSFPTSAHVPVMTKQMSRFRYFMAGEEDQPAADGSLTFTLHATIPFADLVSEFHWNKHFTGNIWATVPFMRAGGVPVRAPMVFGNLQWKGTALVEGGQLKVYRGTIIIFPSRDMSEETKKYRDAVGVAAGYLPDPSVKEDPDALVKLALSHMAKTSARDKVEEIKLWSRAAALGSAPAQVQVGAAIINGEWLTCDPALAGKMLFLASKAGDEAAKRLLKKVRSEQRNSALLAEVQRVVDDGESAASAATTTNIAAPSKPLAR